MVSGANPPLLKRESGAILVQRDGFNRFLQGETLETHDVRTI
jgi:hypothetical protein